jgi:uncharacterized membrane protein
MNWLVRNFLRGLIVVVPVALTVYLLWEAFRRIDRLLELRTPGVGFVVTITVIVLVGWLASNFVGRRVVRLTDAIFARAPLVRIIYASIKDLLEAFVGDRKRFDRPVVVSLTESGDVRALGFVTQPDLEFLDLGGHVAVYLPFSYSMAGTLLVLPRSRIQPLENDSASIMALIVSGGVSRVT